MASTVPPRDWTEIHWPDISGAEPSRWIAVLPLAATEQHGPHLPLGTDVMIALQPPEGLSALNVLPGTVVEIGRADGPIVEMRLDCAGEALIARLTRRSVETLGLVPGRPVYAVIKSIAFDHHAIAGAARPSPGADAETREG